MALLLKGFPVAKAITQQLLPRVEQLAAKGITPTLAILRVGEKEDDISYEKGALKRCSQVGIGVKQLHLPRMWSSRPFWTQSASSIGTIRCTAS